MVPIAAYFLLSLATSPHSPVFLAFAVSFSSIIIASLVSASSHFCFEPNKSVLSSVVDRVSAALVGGSFDSAFDRQRYVLRFVNGSEVQFLSYDMDLGGNRSGKSTVGVA